MTPGPGAVEITRVDPHDDEAYAAFHAAYWEGQRHGVGDRVPAWTAPELRVALADPDRRYDQAAYVARDPASGEVLGTAWTGVPLLDNLHRGDLAVDVRPAHRRRGVGSALLAHVEGVLAARGRRRLTAETTWPLDLGPHGHGWPGVAFAAARGWGLGLVDVCRVLDLPVDPTVLADLAAEVAPHHEAYALRSWVGAVPDGLAESWMRLSATLMTEAPHVDDDAEPEVVDVAALREAEARLARQGRRRVTTVALDAAGTVVACTDLVVPEHEPGRCYQWGTLVRSDHRGHRLGLAVKAANLALLATDAPDARTLLTWNAEVNAPMVAVNERLGHRPVARLGELERTLPA